MYTIVHPKNIEDHWHLVAPWIAQAIGDSDTWADLDVIKDQCKDGTSVLWIGRDQQNQIDVVLVAEVWMFSGKKTLVIRWIAGTGMKNWFDDYHVLETYAMHNGFQHVLIWGCKGWERICKPLGFEYQFTILGKPIIRGLH